MTVTVIVMAKNEERNIEACLDSASGVDEILVLDDHSQDGTASLAEARGARVIRRQLANFADQMNFGASEARGDWIFILDADERFTPGLLEAIRKHLAQGPAAVGTVLRRNFAFGRRHRFGPLKADRVPRLFPRGAVRWQGLVHAQPVFSLPEKPLGALRHYTYRDWDHYFRKLDQYAGLWADDAHKKGKNPSSWTIWTHLLWNQFKMFIINLGLLGGPVCWALCFLNGEYTLKKYLRLQDLNGGSRAGADFPEP